MALDSNTSSRIGGHPARPAVANPYLKKKVQAAITTAAPPKPNNAHITQVNKTKASLKAVDHGMTTGPKSEHIVSNGANKYMGSAVTPHKTSVSVKLPSTKHSTVPSAKSQQPIDSHGHRRNPNVTPTPKKTINQSVSSSTNSLINSTTTIRPAPSTTVKPTSTTSSARPQKNRPVKSTKPPTLKSQLKSQIAALKHQKKERQRQIQYEKEQAAKEEERRRKKEERLRLLKVKEEERRVREEKRRRDEEARKEKWIRKEVAGCLSRLVQGAEVRVQWEKRSGVSYAVGEALQYLVTEVEKRSVLEVDERNGRGHDVVRSFNPTIAVRQMGVHPFYAVNNYYNSWHHHPQSIPFVPNYSVNSSALQVVTKPKPTQPKPLILHKNPMDKYSPFRDSYQVLTKKVCMTKKMGESFGVTLRFECRSVLVPREDDEDKPTDGKMKMVTNSSINISVMSSAVENESITGVTTIVDAKEESNNVLLNSIKLPDSAITSDATKTNAVVQTPSTNTLIDKPQRKKRRKRVNYGVLMVTDASKATFVHASRSDGEQEDESILTLKLGDIILTVNGRHVGGLTFSQACKAIATTSIENTETGVIHCSLEIARMKEPLTTRTPTSLKRKRDFGRVHAA
eukprot:scaffold354778_cov86-Cyclotella_meneghiniana.AAC.1